MAYRSLVCAVLLLTFLMSPPLNAAKRPRTGLSRKQQRELNEKVIPAALRGDPLVLLEELSPLAAIFSPEQIEATDKLLAERSLPTMGELIVGARLLMVHQKGADKLPTPKPRELAFTLKEIDQKIVAILEDYQNHPAAAEELPHPTTYLEYKKLFWTMHVLDNRLSSTKEMASYAARLKEAGARGKQELSPEEKAALKVDFSGKSSRIAKIRRDWEEREIELRVQRLQDAVATLQKSQDQQERLLAAFALDIDGYLLGKFFKDNRSRIAKFQRPKLKNTELRSDIETMVKDGRVYAGDLVEKSRLLFTGMHWWLRGRYGSGPNAGGLLKTVYAMRSNEAMFPLYMPVDRPKPTDPLSYQRPYVPEVDRRHHYIWMAEDRSIKSNMTSHKETVKGPTTVTTFNKFY